MHSKSISEHIIDYAFDIGFSACGITDTDPLLDHRYHLEQWLQYKYHGTMQYMETHFDKRLNPSILSPDAKSIIVVLLNYKPQYVIPQDMPQISKYAYGVDYHILLKKKLYQLLAFIKKLDSNSQGTAFVDSAPVLEKALAVKAGLGWIGKNTLLINPQFGSMTFIGTLFVNINLHYNQKILSDSCGECKRCIDACPTKAILEPKVIDATRCVSYLNKTHKGDIPESLNKMIGNRIFGCDTCIDVCPYNANTPYHNNPELMPKDEIFKTDLRTLSKNQIRRLIMRKK